MTSEWDMGVREFLRGFKDFWMASGIKHTLLTCSKKPLGISGVYSRACNVKEIQSWILQKQLRSSEVACEYIQYISLISKCQRWGGFTMNIIACCSFLMIKNGIIFNLMVFCNIQVSGQIHKFNLQEGPDYITHESVPTFAVGSMARA